MSELHEICEYYSKQMIFIGFSDEDLGGPRSVPKMIGQCSKFPFYFDCKCDGDIKRCISTKKEDKAVPELHND